MDHTVKLHNIEVLSHTKVNEYHLILMKQYKGVIEVLKGLHCVG